MFWQTIVPHVHLGAFFILEVTICCIIQFIIYIMNNEGIYIYIYIYSEQVQSTLSITISRRDWYNNFIPREISLYLVKKATDIQASYDYYRCRIFILLLLVSPVIARYKYPRNTLFIRNNNKTVYSIKINFIITVRIW